SSLPMILIRAFEDHGISADLSAEQIAHTWLNYLGDQHGTLWWGGYGVSTEHTAHLNLMNGINAPRSGSVEQNGAAVAEQIGGQIFSDIWGLVAPDNPALAADLAERASSVSHGGNGIYGGRFVAALVSAAFSETNPVKLVQIGLEQIPADSEYARVIKAMLAFYQREPDDWHKAYQHLKANFGYDRYPGIVHIIPNAGVVALALLYGEGDFSRTIQIANMAGWDTDCNVGNVGAMMGVAVGLAGIESRWREPLNDLLIAASVIGSRNLLTIPQCADLFSRIGRVLAGEQVETKPRYHFSYAGSTNNFLARGKNARAIEVRHSPRENGTLQVSIRKLNKKGEIRIFTRTYYRSAELSGNYYGAGFSPLIYPGQQMQARVFIPADAPDTLQASLYVYDDNGKQFHQAVGSILTPGSWHDLQFAIPSLKDACLSEAGIVVRNTGAIWETGSVCLGEMDWSGSPNFSTTFAYERAETGCISQWTYLRGYWRLENNSYQGSGVGYCESYTGDMMWDDYTLMAELTPLIGDHHLVNTRVGGSLHCYAFGLAPDGKAALYKNDGRYREVAQVPFQWKAGVRYTVQITAQGNHLVAQVQAGDQQASLHWTDENMPYLNGQIGLSTWLGSHTRYHTVSVTPIEEE
ncbi:MAG: ADP-ribosylglycohydrolase family protein, partial [Anaerolineae bacterium]|nr:ADP-ribosylglycohydrolase family protein [Anaerolineae bacterium]